ncbi:hypothetical protein GUJ93_ZPchr0010g8913 [Zizania palustris]|uniref:Uncharacterized protein n=1 Tax=Zizania palustris TaxID=103762 RepID=A0A8J5VVT0_ZIZPA|nr:hypothetical protein GUJ93_ZPchr0010g8913 [Zizania palustris]
MGGGGPSPRQRDAETGGSGGRSSSKAARWGGCAMGGDGPDPGGATGGSCGLWHIAMGPEANGSMWEKEYLPALPAVSHISIIAASHEAMNPISTLTVRGPTCAKMFSDYLSETKEESGIKNIMRVIRGGLGNPP